MAHNYMLNFQRLAGTSPARTVIHYDQLGCGNSTHLPRADPDFWTPALFVDEFLSLVSSLELDGYHIVGQSWGGMLAAEIASRRPSGLHSVSILNSPASMELWVEAAAELRARLPAGMDERMRSFEEAGRTDDPDYLECVAEFYRRHVCRVEPLPQDFADSTEQMEAEPTVYHTMNGPNEFHVVGTLRSWTIIDRLGGINSPTLVLAGEHDEATPSTWRPYIEGINGAEQVVIADASHCSHLEQPDTVLNTVSDFLVRHD